MSRFLQSLMNVARRTVGRRPLRRWTRLRNGLLFSPSHLEVIVADHCNLRCRACNHASPGVGKWFADPVRLARDLKRLAEVYRAPRLLFLGGEPLLHPQLVPLLRAGRESGIAPRLALLSNGLLLHRMAAEAWDLLDEVEVSLYRGVPLPPQNLELARSRAKKLTVATYESFRATLAARGTQDDVLVRKVYQACKAANVWGCHGLRDGYFYKCPESIYLGSLFGLNTEADRVAVDDGPDLQARLLALVNSEDPLLSCRHCAGTCGKQFPQGQARAGQWGKELDTTLEEIVDEEWLEHCLREQHLADDCKTQAGDSPPRRYSLRWPLR